MTSKSVKYNYDVGVIILSFNTLEYLKRSISSVSKGFQKYSYEIIVVDNGSEDGSVRYLRNINKDHNNVYVIENQKNYGFSKAINQGLDLIHSKYAFLLSSDAFMHQGCGDKLIDFMVSRPKSGLVVPSFEYSDGSWQRSFGSIPSLISAFMELIGIQKILSVFYKISYMYIDIKPRKVGYGEGAGLLIRGETLDDIGHLSTDYFFYGEDIEYSYRARKGGWDVYWVPNARLTHIRGGSMSKEKFNKGARAKLSSTLHFLTNNYSSNYVRFYIFIKLLQYLTMSFFVIIGSIVPILRKWGQQKRLKYSFVARLYWEYLISDDIQGQIKNSFTSVYFE